MEGGQEDGVKVRGWKEGDGIEWGVWGWKEGKRME